jgi:hypothetical protein
MAAQGCRAAGFDGAHDAALAVAQMATVLRRSNPSPLDVAAGVVPCRLARAAPNERYLAGSSPQIHRKKPKGQPMPRHIARANDRMPT